MNHLELLSKTTIAGQTNSAPAANPVRQLSEMIHPLEGINAISPRKVVDYFPQNEVAIQESVRSAKTLIAT